MESGVRLTCLQQPLYGRLIVGDVQGSQTRPKIQDVNVRLRGVQLERFLDVTGGFVRPPRVDFDAAELSVRRKVIRIQRKCVLERTDRLIHFPKGSQQ